MAKGNAVEDPLLRTMVDYISEGILSTGPHYKILFANIFFDHIDEDGEVIAPWYSTYDVKMG